jgi:polyphosphate kinase
MEIVSHSFFRVTRDADLALEEADSDDLMEAVESGLHRRHRMSDAVRLEVHDDMPAELLDLLTRELQLEADDVYRCRGLLALGDLDQLCRLERPALFYPVHTPQIPAQLRGNTDHGDIFSALREKEILVHHPYDSFAQSVEAFLSQAASDPQVLTIKHTIYRTQGSENPIPRMLMKAAQAGKQVVTLVELKARFDEQANIEWARRLEESGVHVVYGLVGLKTHAKAALVVRQEEDGIRRYCHIGTGNYNPYTARLYEDLGLLSASKDLGADLADLFNHLTGFSQQPDYRRLLVAPEGLRVELLRLIEEESAAPDGNIVVKCNSLSDPEMIDSLYRASQAGVEIELIVRGICCLRPGVPELSERIRVRSVLGRFLEHSRIFRFGSERRGYRFFFGSADWMTRNLDRRVEAIVPVDDAEQQARLEGILAVLLADDTLAWQLSGDGTWTRIPTRVGICAQRELAKSPA